MLSPDQVPQGWSNIASVYERAFEKLTSQFSREALRQLGLKQGESVLDVAAGTGSFSLAAARAGGDVLGEDNTKRTGEVFTKLVLGDCKSGVPCMTSEACIGIGEA